MFIQIIDILNKYYTKLFLQNTFSNIIQRKLYITTLFYFGYIQINEIELKFVFFFLRKICNLLKNVSEVVWKLKTINIGNKDVDKPLYATIFYRSTLSEPGKKMFMRFSISNCFKIQKLYIPTVSKSDCRKKPVAKKLYLLRKINFETNKAKVYSVDVVL